MVNEILNTSNNLDKTLLAAPEASQSRITSHTNKLFDNPMIDFDLTLKETEILKDEYESYCISHNNSIVDSLSEGYNPVKLTPNIEQSDNMSSSWPSIPTKINATWRRG